MKTIVGMAVLAAVVTMTSGVVRAEAGPASVTVRERATAAGPNVLLRDVAELQGETAVRLGDTVVGSFTEKSAPVRVTLVDIRRLLTRREVNWGKVELGGFGACKVERDAGPAGAAESGAMTKASVEADAKPAVESAPGDGDESATLRERIIRLIESLSGIPREQFRVVFNGDARDVEQSVNEGRFEITPTSSLMAGQAPGRVQLVVRRYDGDRLIATKSLLANVTVKMIAVVAARTMDRGQTIGSGDVELKEVELTEACDLPLTRIDQAVGQMVVSGVKKGSPVSASQLKAPVLVRRGDQVWVRAEIGEMVVRVSGKAMQNAMLGQTVQVKNDKNDQVMTVRVTATNEGVLVGGAGEGPKGPVSVEGVSEGAGKGKGNSKAKAISGSPQGAKR